MSIRQRVSGFVRKLSLPYRIGGGVVLLGIALILWHHFASSSNTASAPDSTPHVSVSSVAELSSQAGPLSVVGTVKSESEATILAQSSGEVVLLSHSIGDHVGAGEVIGEFENSSQRAAVTQAEGSYEAAQAALAKATGATAANSGITSQQASTAAQNAQTALAASLKSAYAALDDAVHAKADALFNNPYDSNPTLKGFTIPDTQLVTNIQNERLALAQTFADASAQANAASGASIDARTDAMLADAQVVESFLSNIITALNEAQPSSSVTSSDISADQTALAAARTEVTAAVTALTAAKTTYDSAATGAQSAQNSASVGTQSDIAAAQASLKSAQGALQAAQANLEKTIIRSPISGTIVSLPITQGDYVSAPSQVAVVSNPSALYVDTSVTQEDASMLGIHNSATVAGNVPGVITFIAPALDPATGKIEVKIGLTGDASALTDGEAVSISLQRAKTATANNASALTIPIVALKITPTGALVFGVTASSTLEAYPVVLGSILGDRVFIASGITPASQIVTDARGLSEGEAVIVDSAPETQASTTPAT